MDKDHIQLLYRYDRWANNRTLQAASAITLSTDGSGPNGDSLDDSLKTLLPGAEGALPGWYGANWSSTGRNRGDCADTIVLPLGECHRHRVTPGRWPLRR